MACDVNSRVDFIRRWARDRDAVVKSHRGTAPAKP
jgi:hypothetical protein